MSLSYAPYSMTPRVPRGCSPTHGFLYCVVAITITYALILPLIPVLPKHLIATADGEPNPEEYALVLAEIG